MRQIVKHRYHFLGILLIILMFGVSVFLRKERLSVPLNRHHEWITAHTLITMDIWRQNGGPSAFNFNPVYSYPGEGNQSSKMLGGIQAEDGNIYYVSYPPFAFIFAYYCGEFLGGPTVLNIRIISLFLHLMCALLIYFLIRQITSDYGIDKFQISGVVAAFLYIFSTGNLWIQGNLYFSDMLVQAFFLLGILLCVRYFRGHYQHPNILLFWIGTTFFFATYTEWLGLLVSFFAGMAFLIALIVTRDRKYLAPFIVIALVSASALLLTVWQYSSIVDFETFKEVSLEKYEYRSGRTAEAPDDALTMSNPESWQRIERFLINFFLMAQNFIGIAAILLGASLVFRRFRAKKRILKWRFIVLSIAVLSVLAHYYLFFNFNAVHDFSTLKTGAVMILIIGILLLSVEEVLSIKLLVVFGIILLPICIYKGKQSFQRYDEIFYMAEIDYNRINSSEKIRQLSRPEAGVYVNVTLTPVMVFYAKHNMTFAKDTSRVPLMMDIYEQDQGQFYQFKGTQVEYMLEYQRNELGQVEVVDKYIFYMEEEDNTGHHFQK